MPLTNHFSPMHLKYNSQDFDFWIARRVDEPFKNGSRHKPEVLNMFGGVRFGLTGVRETGKRH
jgi:hypothetical protein